MRVAALGLLLLLPSFAIGEATHYDWTPPSAEFRSIWAEAEACTGKTGDYDKVHWHLAPGRIFDDDEIGHWDRPYDITIAEDWIHTRWVSKHEMIHVLLQQGHTEAERRAIWGEKCHATWGYLVSDDPSYRP